VIGMAAKITKKEAKDLFETATFHMENNPCVYEYKGEIHVSLNSEAGRGYEFLYSGVAVVVADTEYLSYLKEEHTKKDAVEMLQERINYYLEHEMEESV
jgi:hypothetical protein